MKKEDVKKAIEQLNADSSKRKFSQTYDLIFAFKNLDLKKIENQLDFYITLHFPRGKEVRTCALVGPELAETAKANCTTTINVDDFEKYAKDKKLVKTLADNHEYFIAQATIMPKVATSFGKVLGPRAKMPNPKAGCVVPPNANLSVVYEKLQHTVKVSGKKAPIMQVMVGTEASSEEDLLENIRYIYNNIVHHLPQGENNVKSAYVKYTMGKPIRMA